MKQTEKNNSEFQENNQNSKEQADKKTYSEEEYVNLQAFWTKANQALIDISKKLAENDPKELLNMESKIQNKIIKEVWGYDNLDELRIMLPDVLEGKSTEKFDENNWVDKMEREYRLLKMKLEKKDIDDEIDKYISVNSKIVSSIPNFTEKIKEELKSISSSLPSKERVNKATKLISNSLDIDVETYLQLQWKTMVKPSEQKLDKKDMVTAQNQLRKSLWLKEKK